MICTSTSNRNVRPTRHDKRTSLKIALPVFPDVGKFEHCIVFHIHANSEHGIGRWTYGGWGIMHNVACKGMALQ